MPLDLAKLEQMLAIARTGNFTRAAEELGVTQPALSRNIGLLEERFGFKLFDRGRNGASLTPLGIQVQAEAEDLVRHAAVLEQSFQLYEAGEGGRISLGIGPQIAGLLLPGLGAHMLTTRPLLRMHCSLKTVDTLLPELMEGSIEAILCASGHMAPSAEIAIEPLGRMCLGILARSGHPITDKATVHTSDLGDYPMAIEAAQLPKTFPTKNGGISCENSQILRDIVLASDALWFSSPQIATREIAEGRMVEIDVRDLPFRHVEVGMIRLARRKSSPAVQAIAEYVRTFLGGSAAVPRAK